MGTFHEKKILQNSLCMAYSWGYPTAGRCLLHFTVYCKVVNFRVWKILLKWHCVVQWRGYELASCCLIPFNSSSISDFVFFQFRGAPTSWIITKINLSQLKPKEQYQGFLALSVYWWTIPWIITKVKLANKTRFTVLLPEVIYKVCPKSLWTCLEVNITLFYQFYTYNNNYS